MSGYGIVEEMDSLNLNEKPLIYERLREELQ